MRAAMILAMVGVLAFGIYLFKSATQRKGSTPSQLGAVTETTFESGPRRSATDRVPKGANTLKTPQENPAGSQDTDAPAAKPEPKGPFTIDLGEHTLHFRQDRGYALRIKLSVRVPDFKTRKEVFLKRKQLKRMLYFLGSKRRVDGARGTAGESRFKRDLEIRFRNVIKGGKIDGINVDEYEIIEVELPEKDGP